MGSLPVRGVLGPMFIALALCTSILSLAEGGLPTLNFLSLGFVALAMVFAKDARALFPKVEE